MPMSIAIIAELAGDRLDYEFQRLHGMGKDLYGEVLSRKGFQPELPGVCTSGQSQGPVALPGAQITGERLPIHHLSTAS